MDGQILILYHCNKSNKCLKFIKEDDFLIESYENGRWLGNGMYFWDNIANAKYWKKEKRRKGCEESLSIVATKVKIDNMLDLTDMDICCALQKIFIQLCKKVENKIAYNSDLGFKLNKLFEYIPQFKENYHIIKIYGKYNKTPNNKLFLYNIYDESPEPTLAVKCIYSVRNIECILDKEFCRSD